MSVSENPLLNTTSLPDFKAIKTEHIGPAVDQILAENRELLKQLLQQQDYSWEGLVEPLSLANDRLNSLWSTVNHLNAVMNTDALREVYQQQLPKLTAYENELGQNADLDAAFHHLRETPAFAELNQARKQHIENTLRDFRLSGVELASEQKQTFASLRLELSELSNRFAENVLDATQGWYLHIESESQLEGLPDSVLQLTCRLAEDKGLQGHVLTLDFPVYQPVMTYVKDRAIREQMYQAFMTRASDQGPDAGRWDNSENIKQILLKRLQLAQILGFSTYAERSLATKMAESPQQVLDFLQRLVDNSQSIAQKEFAELQRFARQDLEQDERLDTLCNWDVTYVAEKLKQQRFDISQEELRPYFPAPKVIAGLFECARRLFAVEAVVNPQVSTYHPDVSYYELRRDGQTIAGFYLDLYAREGKRGGAWMSDCRVRCRRADGEIQLPVAFITCNFTPSVDGQPSLLTHNEVTTLFHEFGHSLHHMLTQIDVAEVSGINGVAWDAVELPSQFLENWCWRGESLELISGHFETGDPLPQELIAKLIKARNFQAGMLMMRQLEFASFDFRLHQEYKGEGFDVLALQREVQQQLAVCPPPDYTRFCHSFSHIFAGGYAAGYYSYKWAEVLSADAFSRFDEEGLFNRSTGADFMRCVLEQGGSRPAMDLFVEFRGREPEVEPLLRQSGII